MLLLLLITKLKVSFREAKELPFNNVLVDFVLLFCRAASANSKLVLNKADATLFESPYCHLLSGCWILAQGGKKGQRKIKTKRMGYCRKWRLFMKSISSSPKPDRSRERQTRRTHLNTQHSKGGFEAKLYSCDWPWLLLVARGGWCRIISDFRFVYGFIWPQTSTWTVWPVNGLHCLFETPSPRRFSTSPSKKAPWQLSSKLYLPALQFQLLTRP